MIQSRKAPGGDVRPLTARSVIASTLLGLPRPWLDTATLVRSGALFGIAEGTTRVALSRMAAAGELEPHDGGYRLAGHLVERQARQSTSRHGTTSSWDGTWTLHVVGGDARSAEDRARLRAAMATARFAELRAGVWLRPANLAPAAPALAPVAEQCHTFATRPDGPKALAADLWDLDGWSSRTRQLVGQLVEGEAQLRTSATGALAATFVLSAAALRHLQADPLLPGPLLPTGWPGKELRAAYESFDATFTTVWTDWYRA